MGAKTITPKSVNLQVPSSETCQLLRKLLDKDLERAKEETLAALEMGYRKGDQQVDDWIKRREKLERAIKEVRAIQHFWYLRRKAAGH